MKQDYRLGIDAGGTFTDFIIADRHGGVQLFKSPSTPEDGTRAIRAGLGQIADALGRPASEIVANADLCINGTTVALNALIEKKGARVGLLCTRGHEDSIEIRLGHKEDGYRYDPEYPPAFMLVPRYLRLPVAGRILADGSEREPLDEAAVRDAVETFRREGVEAVAISFLWSVANPAHEARAAAIVRELMPEAFVCTGSEVYPQVREYTRTSTTVVNAYLSPVMQRYVSRIDALFEDLGARQPVQYFQSNGGLALGKMMCERAVSAINSGPASAPQAGRYVARPFGIDNVITVDMGGTSFDITLTRGGQTNFSKNVDFLRYRIGVPMIQVETLGAGGGSIAHLNEFGMLQVGPRSAGATPGPVCYGKGGSEPTVTDANLVLGYLNPEAVLGGTVRLNREAAIAAIRDRIAEPLGISVEHAAYGIATLVNLNMVNGIRRVSVEQGHDPRDFALVGAGGAAGMHLVRLAEEMGIDRILVPKVASGLCAFGQIISNVQHERLSSLPLPIDDDDANRRRLNGRLAELREEGIRQLLADGFERREIECQYRFEIRYLGQIHECTVEMERDELDVAGWQALRASFHARHEALYSYCEPHSAIELVNLECSVIGRVSRPELPELAPAESGPDDALVGHRDMLFNDQGAWTRSPVYRGEALGAEHRIAGPAVIEEATTNIVVPPGWQATLTRSATYLLAPA
ncbi:hydantoinase/oxoprolinase family protein [Halomonas sp. M4R5S39]|uniref:caprolactamase subunit alpha n=1 Tax=Halomonas kalidii TaxID=3043293 RepID=UPI0024A990A7|nr:hydantoinase/oxoprolinase family protein [Halomonas kalidii]MDI5985677.1 hydantoinase/oxoprolinase family protein [Halomonas kalidii]